MDKGSRVKWKTAGGVEGSGLIISKPKTHWLFPDSGVNHFLVAVDAPPGEEHRVIFCAETWLTRE